MAVPLNNLLLRPDENPATRFGAPPAPSPFPHLPAGVISPRINALTGGGLPPAVPLRPPAPPQLPPIPVAPPGGAGGSFGPEPVPEAERISSRAPFPKADFDESEHKKLHDRMGEAFDDPEAHKFARDLYSIVRKSHHEVHPKHVADAVRGAYHAVRHGFMPPFMAGQMVGRVARQRHREQMEMDAHAQQQPDNGGPPDTAAAPAPAAEPAAPGESA